jgi:hypothetical protein
VEVQEHSAMIWKFQRYSVISNFYHSQNIPAPFSLFSYLIAIIQLILQKIGENNLNKIVGYKTQNRIDRILNYVSKKYRVGFGEYSYFSHF